MEPNFQAGDPVQTLENPKGLGKVARPPCCNIGDSDYMPSIGVLMAGDEVILAFATNEVRPCKCKDRIPLGVSQCQTQ